MSDELGATDGPALGFTFQLIRFTISPTRKNYERFLPQCMHDTSTVKQKVGKHWDSLVQYNLSCAQDKKRIAVLRSMMKQIGVPVIQPAQLEQITKPVSLIWGRQDRANKLQIAEEAGQRYSWPLFVIENAGDDPKMEQPEAFLETLLKLVRPQTVQADPNPNQ